MVARTAEDRAGRRRGDASPRTTRRSCARRRGTSIRSIARPPSCGPHRSSSSVRGWERRLGIGLEFEAKAAYAKVIAGAVAATAPAQLVIRSVVAGLDAAALGRMPGVTVIGPRGDGIEIETPRYDLFTRILVDIARQGGAIREIAGNDEIMVSVTGTGRRRRRRSSTAPSSCA